MSNSPDIALEMLYINRIKADDSDVQADIRFGQFLAEQVSSRGFRKHILETVERLEEWEDVILVRHLSRCESTFIDPIHQS